ncbi:hypothetical protein MPTK1_5g09640 [Marchantia polymorpha subsp. ruderalis]|uniref:Uncharacterized protein n=2 Tax=Marchantia polymorpha TaxID=3197 RepID=A0AAF6BGN7_MARPO|nr:hypothetical protein MARPO_0048s0106 [Marchantia polymorpha]BBN11171.1 hypothetical protein Mp_5g09640 [Marchantia polymorpha subsp. ruderalis]|eukprot:PTQ39001.1 hypothetical protein MARPO_0048s0106 [Marchantia polymorpha]
MSSSAARKEFESGEQLQRPPPRQAPFKFLVPLVYAPILPLIRIGLRKQPVLRDRAFTIVLGAALLHGGYLVADLYDVESK